MKIFNFLQNRKQRKAKELERFFQENREASERKKEEILNEARVAREKLSQETIDYQKIKVNLEKQKDGQIFIQYLTKNGEPYFSINHYCQWELKENNQGLTAHYNDAEQIEYGNNGNLISRIISNNTGIEDYENRKIAEAWDRIYPSFSRHVFGPMAGDFCARMLTLFKVPFKDYVGENPKREGEGSDI